MTDLVKRLRTWGKAMDHQIAVEAADEIERLRHPKIIVGSRKLWEAMGKIISEAEIDEATLAAITAYDNCTRLPEDVMGYGPMRAALTAALPHLQTAALKEKADD